VARLEMRLGVRLFDRTPRAVTLTDDGRRFHAQIGPLLAAIEEAADEVSGAAAAVRGRLRIIVDPWFVRWVLVERTFAWLNRNRRLAKDFEASIASAKAWLIIASIHSWRRVARC
jgi:DNA-binding transcriptional LysR family regulator